jgi:hypothetical protein
VKTKQKKTAEAEKHEERIMERRGERESAMLME